MQCYGLSSVSLSNAFLSRPSGCVNPIFHSTERTAILGRDQERETDKDTAFCSDVYIDSRCMGLSSRWSFIDFHPPHPFCLFWPTLADAQRLARHSQPQMW